MMKDSSELSAIDNSRSTKTTSSIANRLNRLETEINWLLTLQTSGPTTVSGHISGQLSITNESPIPPLAPLVCHCQPKTPDGSNRTTLPPSMSNGLSTDALICPFIQKHLEDSGLPLQPHVPPNENINRSKYEDKGEKDDKNRSNKEVSSKEEQTKRPRRKKSFCQCKPKRSKSSLPIEKRPKKDSAIILESRCYKRRCKSLDTPGNITKRHSEITPILKPTEAKPPSQSKESSETLCECKSSSGANEKVRDLCDLVNELSKNQDVAMALSEEWKSKFINMKENCEELKDLHERTQQQKEFLGKCLENEKQQHELLQKLSDSEMGVLRKTLDDHSQHNDDLVAMCEKLRNELSLAEERFSKLQATNVELAKDIMVKFESMEGLQNSKSDKVVQYKKIIREMQKEVDKLKSVCTKNAEWACEESSEKNVLLTKIKDLQRQVVKYKEKNHKQGDKNTILVGILVKLGKNDPNIQNLLQAMSISQSQSSDNSDCTCSSSSVSNLQSCECEEARTLINEMSGVIQMQRNRINELVNITSQLIPSTPDEQQQNTSQKEELEQARKDVEDVKARYKSLELSVMTLRNSIKKGKEQLFTEGKSNASLQNEINVLSKLLDESNDNIKIKEKMLDDQADTIDKLKKEMYSKDDKIAALYKDLNQTKDEKNLLNLKVLRIENERNDVQVELSRSLLDVTRQESTIHNLKKHFELQKRELELQNVIHNKEKEQALRAAQFSTDKLIETMEDFRKQSDSQAQLRHVLTKLLQEKDEQLRTVMDKMSSLTLDPQIVVDALKMIKPKHQISVSSEGISMSESFETSIAVRYTSDIDFPEISTNTNNIAPSRSGTIYKDIESHLDEVCDCSQLTREREELKWDEAAEVYFDVCQPDCIIYDSDQVKPNWKDTDQQHDTGNSKW